MTWKGWCYLLGQEGKAPRLGTRSGNNTRLTLTGWRLGKTTGKYAYFPFTTRSASAIANTRTRRDGYFYPYKTDISFSQSQERVRRAAKRKRRGFVPAPGEKLRGHGAYT
jgi:hypothetical protein